MHASQLLEFWKVLKGGPVKCEFPSLRSAGEAQIVGRSGRALPIWSTVPKTQQSHGRPPHHHAVGQRRYEGQVESVPAWNRDSRKTYIVGP